MKRLLWRTWCAGLGTRQRVRRRFSRAGLAVLGGWAVAGALGVDMERSVAYQVFTFLSALLLLGWACVPFFRGRFAVERQLPRFGTVGEPLHYRVSIRNLTARPQRGLTLLEELADPRPSFEEFAAVRAAVDAEHRAFRVSRRFTRSRFLIATGGEGAVPPLAARQGEEVSLALTPLKRGLLRLGGVTIARADPLGLVRGLARVAAPQTVLILPRRYAVPPLQLPGHARYQPGGVALASSVGVSDEFVALRDYRRGDPLRRIHWRSWARVGRPIVKEYEDEFFVRHALVLDTFVRHPHSEVFEEAVSVAASFACTMQTQESLLDLLFVGTQAYCFTVGRGLAHTEQMLEVLASVRVCPDQPFATLERLVLGHASSLSGCLVILLAWDAPRQALVRKLRAADVPVRVWVVTLPGEGAGFEPGPLADQPGAFRVLEAGAVAEGLLRA